MKKVLIISLLLAVMSCATKIESIKNSPEKYVGEVVPVKGRVSKVVSIPFTDYSFFELTDNSDNIIIFTLKDKKKGEVVKIRAEVIGYDSTNQVKSTEFIVERVREFFNTTLKSSDDNFDKSAEKVGNFISKTLNSMKATYFLIEL